MIKTKKTGVYYNPLEDNDKVFYFTYNDINDNKKKKWVKVGKYSDGIREVNAFNLRAEQISKMKHGKDITVIANKKKKEIVTFDNLAQTYFKDKKSTSNRMSRYNIHIKPRIGNKDIQNISKESIIKLLDEIESTGKAHQTLNSIRELISTIFNHSIKEHNLKILNPCIGIKKYKVDNNRERYLSLAEIKQLKEQIKDNFLVSLFVDLSLQTGGRFETILNIQKKDINLSSGAVTLQNFKTEKTYTGYLQKDFLESIKEYLKTLSVNDYVVSYESDHSEKLTQRQLQHRIKPLLDRLFNTGLDTKDSKNRVVIHTFRHTFASHLAINGVPIYTIMKLMNHAKIEQTLRYAKLNPENGMDAVEVLYK
ncbi:site-specific integrase [Sulfurimonas sp.]|uniref:tyrosine-type recombinase/integrase n=1 Tax=Sulfurimonas sp. TaxID=2022749 RepID=UPI002630E685|nr:site-specific integrase [Sulfurimonas sp.]